MPKRKQTEQKKSQPSEKTKFQRFEYREIPRSQINAAPYNPRTISEYARKQLEKSLDKFGCVEALVWNETTGHLVSGHQRLADLDRREKWAPGDIDYLVGVSVVRLDDRKEKQLNVWLNNRAAQGNFDEDLLGELLKQSEMTLEDIGFTRVDWEIEFGKQLEGLLEKQERGADPIQRDVDAIKERKKEYRADDNNAASNDADYYLMVVFNSANDKKAWLREHGFTVDVRFVSAAEMFLAINGAMDEQGGVIQQAIAKVREIENEPTMKPGRAVELIAADFLSGVPA